jgi:hypothetical protein
MPDPLHDQRLRFKAGIAPGSMTDVRQGPARASGARCDKTTICVMQLRKVPADALLSNPVPMTLSPRARKRAELDAALEPIIRDATADSGVAFRVTLDEDERIGGVRAAVKRAWDRVDEPGVMAHEASDWTSGT